MDFFCLLNKEFIKTNKISKITSFVFILLVFIFLFIPAELKAEILPGIVSRVSQEYEINQDLIYKIILAVEDNIIRGDVYAWLS